jgi:hypothetical protein
MIEREDQLYVAAVAPDHNLTETADGGEPDGPPARLALKASDRSEFALKPDPDDLVVVAHGVIVARCG